MRIPYRWLTEFVETDASAARAAERLVMAGIEVASLTEVAPGLRGVVIGEVLEVRPHPGGGTLTDCVVDGGPGRHRVVCGAPGVRPGLRAAFAPPGAVLPGGRRIETAVVRGTASEGMLCSAAEVGAGEETGALLVLDADAPVGADLASWLGLDDVVLEVEITPNRPDCLSVAGVAREVAALTGGRFRPPGATLAEGGDDVTTLARVSVEDPELCPRYAARVITGVTVGPSPKVTVAVVLMLVGLLLLALMLVLFTRVGGRWVRSLARQRPPARKVGQSDWDRKQPLKPPLEPIMPLSLLPPPPIIPPLDPSMP
jgi:phenylalanyl-tRNA synthetase beta chain